MLQTLTLRGLCIGAGRPKIVAPIMGATAGEIAESARAVAAEAAADMAEWRADFFTDALSTQALSAVLTDVRRILGEKPLLFTFRTQAEGGGMPAAAAQYCALNAAAAQSGLVDLIDVEAFSPCGGAAAIARVQAAGVPVIASNHDFHATPARAELVRRMRAMQEMGADLLKIAVMPTCRADVLTLLSAAREMSEDYAARPLVAISMADMGAVSRVAGGAFGSALTFGTVGGASAPGQMPATALREALELLYGA